MNRIERLVFCKRCFKKEFNINKGVVCSLTGEQATFNGNCKDFELDQKASDLVDDENERKAKNLKEEETAGLSSLGIKSGILAGGLIMISSFLYVILSAIFLNVILFPFVPIILLILGIVTLINGVRKSIKERQKKHASLDDHLLQ